MRHIKSKKILIGAIMLSMTALNSACVSGPFHQQIPETQWVVDEDGNKQKVTLHASTEKSSISLISSGIESYHNKNFSKITVQSLLETQELLFTDANTEKEASKILDKFYKKHADIYDGIYHGNMSDRAILEGVRRVYGQGASIIGNGKMKVPANAVSVKGLNAFIEADEVDSKVNRALEIMDGGTPLFKINGQWKIDAVAIAKRNGYYEKE